MADNYLLLDVERNRAIVPLQSTQTQPAQSISAATDSYDIFEDEPDEVLTDFLEPELTQQPVPQAAIVRQVIAPPQMLRRERQCSRFAPSTESASRISAATLKPKDKAISKICAIKRASTQYRGASSIICRSRSTLISFC